MSFIVRTLLASAALAATLFASPAFAGDIKGSSDHPLVGRYEGSEIGWYKKSDFDEVRLLTKQYDPAAADGGKSSFKKFQGRTTSIRYAVPMDRSILEVYTNIKQQLQSKGLQIEFECAKEECTTDEFSFYQVGQELSDSDPEVYNASQTDIRYLLGRFSDQGTDYVVGMLLGETPTANQRVEFLRVVEIKTMETGKIEFVDASAMQKALEATGRVALYGIYFDTDKDVPKPESEATIKEIAKLLSDNPDLKIIVTGHTDTQGEFGYNVDLSQRRAKSIVNALVKNEGIDKSRLTPFGAGMAAPIASNDNEEGRGKNRRVELVKR